MQNFAQLTEENNVRESSDLVAPLLPCNSGISISYTVSKLKPSRIPKEIFNMKQRFTARSLPAALLVVASIAGTAFAQDAKDTVPAHPRFARLTPHLTKDNGTPATPLTTWNGSFVYKSKTYNYNMVGTAPSTG